MRKINQELAELQANFLQYYRQNLGNKFAELEPIRKKYLHFFWKWGVIFSLGIVVILYLSNSGFFSQEFMDSDLFAYMVGGYFITMYLVLSHPFSAYKEKTKRLTMDKILAFFGDFNYCPKSMPQEYIKKSGLIGNFDRQYSDDFFSGTYNGVKMTLSEEKLTIIVHTSKGNREYTIFRGIMIVLDMNKAFSGQTVVRNDWGIFNFFMRSPKCRINRDDVKLEKVKLEDSQFEKYFEAFSNDQVEARYLLTTAFMERILEVKKRFHGKNIQFSFFDNKLFIAIPTRKDMFETTSLFTTTASYAKMSEVVHQFYSVFSIINLLKLNKRTGL